MHPESHIKAVKAESPLDYTCTMTNSPHPLCEERIKGTCMSFKCLHMAMLSWIPKRIIVCRGGQHTETTSTKERRYLSEQQVKKESHKSKHQKQEGLQKSKLLRDSSPQAAVHERERTACLKLNQSAASCWTERQHKVEFNIFHWLYNKAQQTAEEGQLQPSAKQLTGDLAQQRFLPRCPTLFVI